MNQAKKPKKIIGILALQGDYEAHRNVLEERLGKATAFVRTPGALEGVDALILPGGESTTIGKLMARNGLDKALTARAQAGMPIYGTCAGLILLARGIEGQPDQPTLGLMDVQVARNAFGRQIESFEADVPFTAGNSAEETPVQGVFIRAPYVTQAGPDVQVLSRFRDKIVGVRQGHLLGTAFHPELTEDPRVHAYFAQMVEEQE
ncbi:MAG TPA: pyridoxal 5'-phosphate synthase glutaminase subunit PdxT [Chthonomonadaceae bacterium]|nr:pyridoxal 5'-phosphate synthase glutaminase subunit PdxT [Chthonomonadaceae bacterium]